MLNTLEISFSYVLQRKKTRKVKCDVALPSVTQNELDGGDAKTLVNNGVVTIGERPNMSSTPEAIEYFL